MQLTKKNGWFYIIRHSLSNVWGFGITLDAESRLRKGYCNPSCSKQEFVTMYYGDYRQITDLERHLKNQWEDYRIALFDEKLEWIDPKYPIIGKDIEVFCEDRIFHYPYKNIYKVKSEHLPFSPSKYFDTINDEPDRFLELVNQPLTTSKY